MAITAMATTLRNTLLDAIDDAINAGSGTTGGTINLYTGIAGTLLATLTFSATAFGAAAAGAMTAASITGDSSADASGTVTIAEICNKSGTLVYRCTVGTSGADITITSATITAGDAITCSSFVLTAPAA